MKALTLRQLWGPGTATTGWIDGTGRLCSPWLWRGFQVLDAASTASGSWYADVGEYADFLQGGPRPKETEFVKQLRGWLDANRDGKLDEAELDRAHSCGRFSLYSTIHHQAASRRSSMRANKCCSRSGSDVAAKAH